MQKVNNNKFIFSLSLHTGVRDHARKTARIVGFHASKGRRSDWWTLRARSCPWARHIRRSYSKWRQNSRCEWRFGAWHDTRAGCDIFATTTGRGTIATLSRRWTAFSVGDVALRLRLSIVCGQHQHVNDEAKSKFTTRSDQSVEWLGEPEKYPIVALVRRQFGQFVLSVAHNRLVDVAPSPEEECEGLGEECQRWVGRKQLKRCYDPVEWLIAEHASDIHCVEQWQ